MNNDYKIDFKIIAVDFDGTLCYSNWPELGEPNMWLIDYLLKEKAAGNKLAWIRMERDGDEMPVYGSILETCRKLREIRPQLL